MTSITNVINDQIFFRLVKYDSKRKTNTVLIKDLSFANGVQLSSDESFVLVSETGKFRILR